MRPWFVLICLFLTACNLEVHADEVIFKGSSSRLPVGKGLELYVGKYDTSFSQISTSTAFRPLASSTPNLGTSSTDIWLRLPVTNHSKDENLLLEIAYPLLDMVELFVPSEGGSYTSVKLGEHQVFSKRKYQVPNYVFDIHIPTHTTQVFFLRVRSTEQVILPIYVSNDLFSILQAKRDNLVNGIYIGIVLIMAVYNLFLFFSVREKGYLYYVLYVIFAGITQMGIKGYSFQYLWPDWPSFATKGPIVFGCLSGIAALLFADSFLQLRKNAPRARRAFTVFIVSFIASILMVLSDWKQSAFLGMQLITGVASLFVLFVSYRVMIRGYKPAKYFVLGWTILLLGSVLFLLKDYGVLEYNDLTSNTVQVASVIEMALLSFGLAYSINILKDEKEKSQARELQVSLEN